MKRILASAIAGLALTSVVSASSASADDTGTFDNGRHQQITFCHMKLNGHLVLRTEGLRKFWSQGHLHHDDDVFPGAYMPYNGSAIYWYSHGDQSLIGRGCTSSTKTR